MTARDRFGNGLAPGLPYARGRIIQSTGDDIRKIHRAWRIVEQRTREHGPDWVFDLSGLDRGLPLAAEELIFAHDEIAPALYLDRVKAFALEQLGGSPGRHDAVILNRLTAATVATHLTLVEPETTVVGVSASYSHPTVARAAGFARARFVDVRTADALRDVLERDARISLVVLTRLAATYDLLPLETIWTVVRLAHERDVPVYLDDAGGARVCPATFRQPRMLELGVDLGATGLDKYGTIGPRLGLLAGEAKLVARIYACAVELGLEARPMLYPAVARSLAQYTPERVRALVETTQRVAAALRPMLGGRLRETEVAAQLPGEDILELAMQQAGVTAPPIVPIEATAVLAMLLLEDYGVLTAHFAGLPPGNCALLLKFIPPETLERFGGPRAFAEAVIASLGKLGGLLTDVDRIRVLLGGEAAVVRDP